jgi:hypothetical protein
LLFYSIKALILSATKDINAYAIAGKFMGTRIGMVVKPFVRVCKNLAPVLGVIEVR